MDENKKQIIMIVEDEADLGDIFSELVRSIGYEPVYCGNGKIALDYLEQHKIIPALVMCDVNMPIMSGVEFLKQQMQRNLNLNICMVTANATSAVIIQALQLGVMEYVTKPFKIDELREKIERLAKIGIKINSSRSMTSKNDSSQQEDVGEKTQKITLSEIENSLKTS